MTRAFRFLALLLSAVLVLGACGDDDTATTDESDGATADADGDDPLAGVSLVSDGSLTVCTDAPYEPFEFEGDDGEFTGFDMELLREIGSRLDLELAVTVQPFDGIWLGPAAGNCDIVASAMTITPERAAAVTFSDPYFDADQSLLVRADDEDTYGTLADLAGKRIAVQTGTTGETYANEQQARGRHDPGLRRTGCDVPRHRLGRGRRHPPGPAGQRLPGDEGRRRRGDRDLPDR